MRFADRLRKLLGIGIFDDNFWDDLFDLLVEGDMGPLLTEQIVTQLKEECKAQKTSDGKKARMILRTILRKILASPGFSLQSGELSLIMLLGVNGVGKTTTSAKLAAYYGKSYGGENIIQAAGDTFRAAAIEQLKTHGQRLGIRVIAQTHGSDSGAVIFDAIESAQASSAKLIIADTAGRMHTKQNLLMELKKIDKIVLANIAPGNFKKLLVLDATTGSNALRQAETFAKAVKIYGIVLTKYDSSARGGIIATISRELGIPTFFLGTGESYDDFEPFRADSYLDDFLGMAEE